jgi:hypothetical protein
VKNQNLNKFAKHKIWSARLFSGINFTRFVHGQNKKSQIISKSLEASKPKGLNMIAKVRSNFKNVANITIVHLMMMALSYAHKKML